MCTILFLENTKLDISHIQLSKFIERCLMDFSEAKEHVTHHCSDSYIYEYTLVYYYKNVSLNSNMTLKGIIHKTSWKHQYFYKYQGVWKPKTLTTTKIVYVFLAFVRTELKHVFISLVIGYGQACDTV